MILERRFRKLKFLQFCIARLLPKKQYLCLLTISVTATYYLSWFIIVTFSSHGIEYLATLAYNHLINIIYIHSQLQPYRTGQLIPIFGTVDFYPRNINSYTFMGFSSKSLILYIVSTCEQHFSNKFLQNGAAAVNRRWWWLSNLPVHIIFTIRRYEFENYEKVSYAQKLDQKSVYFVTGKFTILDTGLLELAISSCNGLPISKKDISVCKPIV